MNYKFTQEQDFWQEFHTLDQKVIRGSQNE